MFRGHTCSLRLLKLFNFKIFGVPQKRTPGLKTGNYEKKNCFGFCIIIENTILLTRNLLSSSKTSSAV